MTKELNDKLLTAADDGDYMTVCEAIEVGADVNAKCSMGWTALICASRRNEYRDSPLIVKILLENGADVNLQDRDGKTPLMSVNYWGSTEISKLLIESGADVNLKDKCGTTALMQKCQDALHDSAKLLIDAGADVNAKNNKGQTALMLACIKGRYNNSIYLLLENGADINAQDNQGNTALMLAGVNEEVETVKLLLSFEGVDAALKNKQGDTVLMMVVHYALADACNYEDEWGGYENYDYNNNKETPNLNYIKIIKFLEDHINNN